MQGKLQETLSHLESVRMRVASLDIANDFLPSAASSSSFASSSSVSFVPGASASVSGIQMNENINPELEHRTRKVSDRFAENIQIIANEPSLAFFRIQEHIRSAVPQLVDSKHEVQHLQTNVQGSYFDTEYAIRAVTAMEDSKVHFQNIQDLIKNAMFMKQQIKYERERRKNRNQMMRTQTLDVALAQNERQRRSEFTQSVQLPTTTSLQQFEDPPRVRSSSVNSQHQPPKSTAVDNSIDIPTQ